MTSHPDSSALETRLDFVHARMLELHVRVATLEAQLHGRALPHTAAPTPSLTPSPIPSPIMIAPTPEQHVAEPSSQAPIRTLAIAGGGALLLGLAYFVVHAIEQDWLAPGVRFGLTAIASALLTVAAWPIARRGHEAVAGAIGGAGLGGWFAAWLVARHAHELVSVPAAFLALAAGAAACLLIADRLRLRLMAGLATVAACATPVLVADGPHLHELMLYQLAVIVGVLILDGRRRWPELPTISLLATWLLAASWAESHLHGEGGVALMVWAVVLLAVSAASAWRLLVGVCERDEQVHVHARLLIGGLATWTATAAVYGIEAPVFAAATAVLALWHLALALVLQRKGSDASELFLALGGLQVFVLGPLQLEQAGIALWWMAMGVTAMVVPWAGLARLRGAGIVIPALAALGWCVVAEQPWSLGLGLTAAAVLLVASVWRQEQRPHPGLAILGTLGWAVVVFALGPASIVAQLCWALLPIAAVLCWACAQPTEHALRLATVHLGLGLVGVLAVVVDSDALGLHGSGDAGERLGMAVLLIGLAGLAATTIALRLAARAIAEPGDERSSVTAIGLATAAAIGLALALGVALISDGSASLGQVGYSLVGASVGLGLIVAGLRLDDGTWRQVGLGAIALAAAKVVLLDLAAAPVGWRALSFVGLGAILIGGAFAYSRAQRRACPTT